MADGATPRKSSNMRTDSFLKKGCHVLCPAFINAHHVFHNFFQKVDTTYELVNALIAGTHEYLQPNPGKNHVSFPKKYTVVDLGILLFFQEVKLIFNLLRKLLRGSSNARQNGNDGGAVESQRDGQDPALSPN